jgi:8-hydroxy-5-deazaflavin:NADPH oxidoreductase
MTISIVGGTGDLGFGLALRLGRAGQQVVIGSRARERAEQAADRARQLLGEGDVRGLENPEAVKDAEVVFVTVPFAGQADIYRSVKDHLPDGVIVCDTTTPLATAVGGRPTQVIRPWHGSAAEQAAALLPDGARLVSGFHSVGAEALENLDGEADADVLVCGNDAGAKARIGELVDLIPGLRWADCGPLTMARVIEPLTAVLISLNRKYGIKDAGVRLSGRDGWGPPRK